MTQIAIEPYSGFKHDLRIRDGLDAIFFETSTTKTFASDAEKSAFRARWLGQYLELDSRFAFVARTPSGDCAGYIVASLNDPAQSQHFAGIGYFQQFKDLTRIHPAHLHVNVAAGFRGHGIGKDLVATALDALTRAGAKSVHVMTGRDALNVPFYLRQGFRETGATDNDSKAVVFLVKPLAHS